MSENQNTTEFWAIVEVMGHQMFAGQVSEQNVAGAGFVRIDVPANDGHQAFSKLFGPSSIYCITPVTEETARAKARTISGRQVMNEWDVREAFPGLNQRSLEYESGEPCDECGEEDCDCLPL